MITGLNQEYLVYLLKCLNTKLFNKIILQSANLTGGKGPDFLGKVPIVYPTMDTFRALNEINMLVKETERLKQIEKLICRLYSLSKECEFLEEIYYKSETTAALRGRPRLLPSVTFLET